MQGHFEYCNSDSMENSVTITSDEENGQSSQEDLILQLDDTAFYQNQMEDPESREVFEAYYNGNKMSILRL